MADNNASDITALTVQLVSAFVANNTVKSEDLASLIHTTRSALTNEPNPTPAQPEAPTYTPAVSVRKSLSSSDHILSLIDGKPYKTLKRHLAANGLTPEEYRSRYNLPKSYPLVAASYSDARRAVASKIGLGRKPVTPAAPAAAPKTAAVAAPAAAPAPVKAKAPAKPAAPKKAVNGAAKAKPAKAAAPAAAANAAPKAAAAVKTAPAAEAKAVPAKAEPRKRLSIAGPKAEKPAAKAEAAAKAEVKTTAPKVKTESKPAAAPKTAKAAPKAKPAAAPKEAKPAAAEKKPTKAAVNGDAKPKADAAPANA